ncbi:uncharacterized protein LOC119070814 [Bradysia coprophila]|uniref:uncharacterized protein LOC119070814 n=1 Tax=Bradysia coprophila TaxID=38358 RepID=UPI00187DA39E|nr:uncharacterized protein LOC119070814 [Bradysia coprophila]
MAQFRLTIFTLIIIGVLQVYTNPISTEEETDVSKLFSADELQRAKDAGLPVQRLVEGYFNYGFTFEDMMKLQQLQNSMKAPKKAVTPEDMYPVCQIFLPELKMAASYTSAQEAYLSKLLAAINRFEDKHDHIRFLETTVCSYLGRPDLFDMAANAFGLTVVPYMQMRFMAMKAEKAKGTGRVKVVKQMCCLNKHRDEAVMLGQSTFTALPDEEMNAFAEHWDQFEIANTLKSFENICKFLDTKDQTNDECVVAIPVPNAADQE